ncbi:MAG: PLP-dependent aspartate aminotransferase family protein [Haliangiales bacterium]
MSNSEHIETKLIHAGEPRPRIEGAATIPIFQSTVFEHRDGADYHGAIYPRLSNLPNHHAMHAKLAALEGGEAALVTASGMAAISSAVLTVLGAGGHLLLQEGVYGGTHSFVTEHLPKLGHSFDFIDCDDGANADTGAAAWKAKLRPNTRAIYVETMSNPMLQVSDHRAVIAFAREHGLIAIIDNTFASPVNFRPIEHGYDIVVHSCTKYMNGHSDLVAGCVVGGAEQVEEIRHTLNHLGGSIDPLGCFLLQRGLKTLALRVRAQNHNALAVARHLAAHDAVSKVIYPGLPDHPHHARAKELFDGFGGMLSFELSAGASAAERFSASVELITHAPSLGGPETLVTRPVTTSHVGMPPAERERLGITDGLMRVSIGFEHVDDITADIDQAIRRALG